MLKLGFLSVDWGNELEDQTHSRAAGNLADGAGKP